MSNQNATNAQTTAASTRGENIALHQPVTFNKPPSYPLCSDPDDDKQITDGLYADGEGAMWAQKPTVGWVGGPINITIDLGKTEPIEGVSYGTGGGVASVTWPASLLIFVSDDGKTWHYSGDLVELSARPGGGGLPPASGYTTHRYATHELATRGRYVSVANPAGVYIFCDEIEVYRGAPQLLQKPAPGPAMNDVLSWLQNSRTRLAMARRINADAARVLAEMEKSALTASRKAELAAQLRGVPQQTQEMPDPDLATFRTTMPQNDIHARIFAAHGAVLKARGLPPMFAWKKADRYAWLDLLEAPIKAPAAPAVAVKMMRGEFRADSFLLTNATEKPLTAQLKIEGVAGGAHPSWLTVSPVAWTDTAGNVPVADALPVAPFQNGAYQIPLPAGLTRKVWLTIDSSKLPSGAHNGTILVTAGAKTLRLPLRVLVSKVHMNKPRLSLGTWDYTDGNGGRGITPRNRDAAIALQRSHFVDSPWAGGLALPLPVAADFDAAHQLKNPPSFAVFDDWVKRWPGARHYLVFLSVGATFAGTPMGSPEFDARVGNWAKSLAQHMRDLKLNPQQLGLLLVDEPLRDEQDTTLLAWMKPIKAAASELTIFSDPQWERPASAARQEAFSEVDILSPALDLYFGSTGAEVAPYYAARRAAGQTLWFYQCDGPTRTFNPVSYYRAQAWHAFAHGASGIGFWSFSDTGGAESSWNEYGVTAAAFEPEFLGRDDATDSIHWQAVREGVEDYEYLAMLRDAASKTADPKLKNQATTLLKKISDATVRGGKGERSWPKSGEQPGLPFDAWRLQVLALLEKMAA